MIVSTDQVLEWVPLGVASLCVLSVMTFLRASFCGRFAVGGVLGMSVGFEGKREYGCSILLVCLVCF